MSEMAFSPGCESVRPELNAFVDGELTPAEQEAVERHLEGCADCRSEVALLGLVTQSLRLVARPEPSETMRERLLAHVMAELPMQRLEIVCREQHGQQLREWSEVRRFRASFGLPPTRSERAASAGRITRRWIQTMDQGSYRGVIAVWQTEGRD